MPPVERPGEPWCRLAPYVKAPRGTDTDRHREAGATSLPDGSGLLLVQELHEVVDALLVDVIAEELAERPFSEQSSLAA